MLGLSATATAPKGKIMSTFLKVVPTIQAELGALVPVDAFGHTVETLLADGVRIDQIDISDIYAEDGEDWGRLVTHRLEESYGLRVHFFNTRSGEPTWKVVA